MIHVRSGQRACLHRRYELVGEERRVLCKDCGSDIDAFDALEDLARRVERYIYERQENERKAKQSARALAEAERLLRNAKAKIRRAVGQGPVCDCPPEFQQLFARGARFDFVWCPKCGGRRP